jgi:hypothetical protein
MATRMWGGVSVVDPRAHRIRPLELCWQTIANGNDLPQFALRWASNFDPFSWELTCS